MTTASKPPLESRSARRIWKTPLSRFNWLFLSASLLVLLIVLLLARASSAAPNPNNDPYRAFGIVAFITVLFVAAYTLRRRFVRRLPGKVHNWLWLHIWFGILSVLLVGVHENWQNITQNVSFVGQRFTEAAFGTTALYALIFLVLSGLGGRLLDLWQARVIASEADNNGAGIASSVEDHLRSLRLTIERLSAGKSLPFKRYCNFALSEGLSSMQPMPNLPQQETADFQRVRTALSEYARLALSLQRQQRARRIIRTWRAIHSTLACVALLVIGYHAIFELIQIITGQ